MGRAHRSRDRFAGTDEQNRERIAQVAARLILEAAFSGRSVGELVADLIVEVF